METVMHTECLKQMCDDCALALTHEVGFREQTEAELAELREAYTERLMQLAECRERLREAVRLVNRLLDADTWTDELYDNAGGYLERPEIKALLEKP